VFLLSQILEIGLLAALGVLLLVFLYRVLSLKRTPSLGEAVGRWRKALSLILIVSLLGSVVSVLQMALAEGFAGSVKVGYNYPNASKGLAPNGATFNVNEILSDEVLEDAISRGGLKNLTAKDLKECLEITNAGKQDRELTADTLYVSTEYNITYQPSLKTMLYGKNQILNPLTEAYYNYFLEKHGRKTNVLEVDFSELEGMEYLDVCTWFDTRASDIRNYMSLCGQEDSTFLSDTTQESFSSVQSRVDNFRSVSLERFESYVLKYGLSENREQYISRLNQRNRIGQVRYMKDMAGYYVRLAAIDLYDRDVITPVLVPTRDDDGEFYQSRTKTETDVFADEADSKLEAASDELLWMETRNHQIRMLSAEAGGEEEVSQAESMEETLVAELTELSELALATVADYEAATVDGYLSFSYGEKTELWLGYAKKAVLYFSALFLVLSAGIAIHEKVPERKPQKKRSRKKKTDAGKTMAKS